MKNAIVCVAGYCRDVPVFVSIGVSRFSDRGTVGLMSAPRYVEPQPETQAAAAPLLQPVDDVPVGAPAPRRLMWLSIGFFAGIAVWHLVGFWSFVTAVLLTGHAPTGNVTTMILDAEPSGIHRADEQGIVPPAPQAVARPTRTVASEAAPVGERVSGWSTHVDEAQVR